MYIEQQFYFIFAFQWRNLWHSAHFTKLGKNPSFLLVEAKTG